MAQRLLDTVKLTIAETAQEHRQRQQISITKRAMQLLPKRVHKIFLTEL